MGEQKKYWIGFNLVSGVGPARLKKLIDTFGGVEQAWKASRSDLSNVGLHRKLVDDIVKAQKELNLDREVAELDSLGIQVLTWEDYLYPSRLLEIDSSPPVIYVWGRIESVDRYSVAIVGTRRKSGRRSNNLRTLSKSIIESSSVLESIPTD